MKLGPPGSFKKSWLIWTLIVLAAFAINAFTKNIVFYGVVVDEEEHPLAGATITLKATHWLYYVSPDVGTTQWETTSDPSGHFSVHGRSGLFLTVEQIRKSGYSLLPSINSFGYNGQAGAHHPDRDHPVAFVMLNGNSQPAGKVLDRMFRIQWNSGEQVLPLGVEGSSLRIRSTRQRKELHSRDFPWAISITADGCQLVELDPADSPLAPLSGYVSAFDYSSGDSAKWSGFVTRVFAFKTATGKYGLLKLEMECHDDDSEYAGNFSVNYNRGGSRNIR